MGNIPDKLRRRDREDAKRDLHDIMNAHITAARAAARRFADRRRGPYPKVVACLRDDLPACFRYPRPTGAGRCTPRTPSNDASGRSGEGHGPWMDTFRDRTPMGRVPFAILPYRNKTTEPSPLSP